jgi:ribonuclease J
MTSLTFHGGAGEIGGTKILLQDKDTKLFLDFGEGFSRGDEYAYDYLKVQNAHGLSGLFEFDLMPRIPRVFSEDALRMTDMKYEEPNIDGIIISHSHSDHICDLKYVDPRIPVHIGHGTQEVARIYHEIYPQLFDIGKHDTMLPFSTGDKIEVKGISFEPVHVEHSVPGAYGFIIKTSKGPVVYTGDLRMHGPRGDMTKEFLKKAKQIKPYALLIEGTNMSKESEHNFTEAEVKDKVEEIVSKSRGTVFTYFPSTNVDRFMTFYNAAVKNKRKLVIDTNLAYYVNNIRPKLPILPDIMSDPNVMVYFPPKKSCTFCEADYHYKDDKAFLPKMINYRDINNNPKKYIMHMSFNKLAELVCIKPKNADFIYSSSEHFYEGEDNEEQRNVWENWMNHFGIAFHKAHCSGHACRDDLVRMIETIKPYVLIPVHTNVPEEFKKYHDNVILPVKEGDIKL